MSERGTPSTWLITGISSGFGRLMAEQLLMRGDVVAGTVRDPASVQPLKDRYGDRLWLAELDLTDFPAIRPCVDRAFADLARIDVVISNAGYGLFGAAEELTDEQVKHQIDTNLVGPIHLARAAIPHMRRMRSGRLIAISSFGGQTAGPGASLYNASKWGLEGFFDALGYEMESFGIGVTIVEPGGASTGFRNRSSRLGPALDAYVDTPVNRLRRRMEGSDKPPRGDPAKMAAAIIAAAETSPAPKRVPLGSDSYREIRRALLARLADLETRAEQAASTDLPEATV